MNPYGENKPRQIKTILMTLMANHDVYVSIDEEYDYDAVIQHLRDAAFAMTPLQTKQKHAEA